MGFKNFGSGGAFKTEPLRFKFVAGFGVVLQLTKPIPRRYDDTVFGPPNENGLLLTGTVVKTHGAAPSDKSLPAPGSVIDIVLRPSDSRRSIFDDLEKTRSESDFFFEGVTFAGNSFEARWAHGAGQNRAIQSLEIVGPPNITFENPIPEDGEHNGWLSLNLDGSPTTFDVFETGKYVKHNLPFNEVVDRLKIVLEKGLKFRISQRVIVPSRACLVKNQDELESALTRFRAEGLTGCFVRSFVPGTTDPEKVDTQLMGWPLDVPASAGSRGNVYKMPVLFETKRFMALANGDDDACMEVIPGYYLALIGNKDSEKSTKHNFIRRIIAGMSADEKNMYGSQNYGPGIAICAVNDDGLITGLTRLALRTDGNQFISVASIPTLNFPNANSMTIKSDAVASSVIS